MRSNTGARWKIIAAIRDAGKIMCVCVHIYMYIFAFDIAFAGGVQRSSYLAAHSKSEIFEARARARIAAAHRCVLAKEERPPATDVWLRLTVRKYRESV